MTTRVNEVPKIERVEVHAALPEPADLRRIATLVQARSRSIEPVTWVYKLYVADVPEPRGAALELFIDDRRIQRYSEFPGGIYFTVNDPDLVREIAGGSVRFRQEGQAECRDTASRIPPVEDSQRSLLPTTLPRQIELLRK
jgi:hypothetical protein